MGSMMFLQSTSEQGSEILLRLALISDLMYNTDELDDKNYVTEKSVHSQGLFDCINFC